MTRPWRFQWGQQTYSIHFKLGFGLFCLAFFVLFCVLGYWQTYRYHFKKTLLATYQERLTATPVPFSAVVMNHSAEFQQIQAKGEYVNNLTVFLQNRFYKNKPGFEVLTPFKIAGEKKLLLIDRGWVPAPEDKSLPQLPAVLPTQTIQGYLKFLNEYQFILGKNLLATHFPLVMQKIDIEELKHVTQQSFFPFILRLSPHATNGFIRDWIVVSVQPERHLGYAIQWFLMAFVLLIAYFCFCCERVRDDLV